MLSPDLFDRHVDVDNERSDAARKHALFKILFRMKHATETKK